MAVAATYTLTENVRALPGGGSRHLRPNQYGSVDIRLRRDGFRLGRLEKGALGIGCLRRQPQASRSQDLVKVANLDAVFHFPPWENVLPTHLGLEVDGLVGHTGCKDLGANVF